MIEFMVEKSLQEIGHILSCVCKQNKPIRSFAIDSRLATEGSLFFALKGEKVDGHQFLEEVAKKGSVAAVVDKSYTGPDFGLVLLLVDDVRGALQILAKAFFSTRKEKVIAVTGSMGKTTTKEFLATLLEEKYRVAKTPGNYNSQVTVPLTLLNLEGEYDVIVIEMGMGRAGQIARLASIAPPDIAVLTKIAPAGMEDFQGGLEAIAAAKAEIFSQKKTRLGIISSQASRYREVLYGGGIPKWIYGWKGDLPDIREADFVMEEKKGSLFINDSPPISFSIEGAHMKENFLAAATSARAMGLSWDDIQRGAKKCRPFALRFQKIVRDGITFIQDCYNANPDSMAIAMKNLPRPASGGKVIGVLGNMPDLGSASTHYHRSVAEIATEHLDEAYCIGADAKHISSAFLAKGKSADHFPDLMSIKAKLFARAKPGDVVLIKGANSLKLWEILEA